MIKKIKRVNVGVEIIKDEPLKTHKNDARVELLWERIWDCLQDFHEAHCENIEIGKGKEYVYKCRDCKSIIKYTIVHRLKGNI